MFFIPLFKNMEILMPCSPQVYAQDRTIPGEITDTNEPRLLSFPQKAGVSTLVTVAEKGWCNLDRCCGW
jgi:hypothetical protein